MPSQFQVIVQRRQTAFHAEQQNLQTCSFQSNRVKSKPK